MMKNIEKAQSHAMESSAGLYTNTHGLKRLQAIQTPHLYDSRPHGYSHAVEVRHVLRCIHIAGQGGQNSNGALAPDYAAQLEQVFENIMIIIEEAAATIFDIAMLRVYIVDYTQDKHQQLIQQIQKHWGEHAYPACSLIPVPALALQGMLVEIEATVYCL